MSNNLIKEGDFVVFDINGERQSLITAKPKTPYFGRFSLHHPPEAHACNLQEAADSTSLARTHHAPSPDWNPQEEIKGNNSKLEDANQANQKLSAEEINAMKQSGKAGKEIVEALANNSTTFESKTQFAQAKYKRKKIKKYVFIACARRPTAASISTALYSKQPSRVGFLRPDALAMLLHMANVGSNGRVLVLEGSGGLVTGAVAERLGGHGLVCSTFIEKKAPSIETIRLFNFAPEVRATIVRASLFKLLSYGRDLRARIPSSSLAERERETVAEENKEEGMLIGGSERIPEVESGNNNTGMQTAVVAESLTPHGGLDIPLPFTSFILNVPSIHPAVALHAVFPLLAPSASFAVANSTMQPLAECMDELRTAGTALNMTVQETWMRDQQMLPQRTHPFMGMNHGGGYLLSGTVTFLGTELPLVLPDDA